MIGTYCPNPVVITLVAHYSDINEGESAANEVTYLVNTSADWRTRA